MSKKFLILIEDNYLCGQLELLRNMHTTHDYSGLLAIVERAQNMAQNMEDGLYAGREAGRQVIKVLDDKKLKPNQKLERIRAIINSRWFKAASEDNNED